MNKECLELKVKLDHMLYNWNDMSNRQLMQSLVAILNYIQQKENNP